MSVRHVGPMRHRPRPMNRGYETYRDSAGADVVPLVAEANRLEKSLGPQPLDVGRGRHDRRGPQQTQRPDLGMVVMEVRQKYGVGAGPSRRIWPRPTPTQWRSVPEEQWVRQQPNVPDIDHHGRVTEPGQRKHPPTLVTASPAESSPSGGDTCTARLGEQSVRERRPLPARDPYRRKVWCLDTPA
jgi:hypothetical protein